MLFAISMWKTCYFKHQKYQNLWMNSKVRGDKNATCLHFLPYLLNICRKFEFPISHRGVAICLRWGGYCCIDFVANFIRFAAVQTFWKLVTIWQSYREFEGGNFFETQQFDVCCTHSSTIDYTGSEGQLQADKAIYTVTVTCCRFLQLPLVAIKSKAKSRKALLVWIRVRPQPCLSR